MPVELPGCEIARLTVEVREEGVEGTMTWAWWAAEPGSYPRGCQVQDWHSKPRHWQQPPNPQPSACSSVAGV